MLSAELDGAKLEDVPRLVEHLFPDDCLPMPPSQLLAALSSTSSDTHPSGVPLYDDYRWTGCPDLSKASKNGDVEKLLTAFLETIIEHSAQIFRSGGKESSGKSRRWTAEFATAPVPGAANVRHPDLLCVDGETCGWADVLIHGELKSSSGLKGKSFLQLVNGAYHAFSAQDDRRFFVSLSIVVDQIRFVIFDRSGMTIATPFDIHQNPETFLRVLTGLMFCEDRARLGYDTSIVTREDGRRFIDVEGRSYELVETLFISDVIRGRGTVCWHARCDGQDYVIKDTWADTSRPHTEAEILRMAKEANVSGVPTVIADVIVQINGLDDATENIRSTITHSSPKKLFKAYSLLEKRVHRRIVLTPYCLPLTSFQSRKELVSIFIDAVTAHRDLVNANILHRDISLNNVMVAPLDAPADNDTPITTGLSFPLRRGLLIDVDYALVSNSTTERSGPSVGHRTGTLPFMAVDVLIYGDTDWTEHEPKHDLESFLYVLVWICWHYAGPKDAERQNFDIYAQTSLRKWISGADYEAIGRSKRDLMGHVKDWERIILANFAPYFEPLKPCVSAWRQLYVDDKLTHDAVLAVLTDALPGLEMEIWSRHNDPDGYGVAIGSKRKREQLAHIAEGDHDDDEVVEGGVEVEEINGVEDESSATDDELPRIAQTFHSAPPHGRLKLIHQMKPKPAKRLRSSETAGLS
ncbi:hypothetical protein B0H11DRAFT_325431 [Mycena galericulata]|nr:hypothetical protein B0H11DRAFT_325431 [Mycena galericulata]